MKKDRMIRVLIGIGVCSLMIFGWYTVRMYQNRKMTEAIIAERNTSIAIQNEVVSETSVSEKKNDLIFLQDEVEWNGKIYRRNTYVKAILCMGVDRSDDIQGYQEFDEAGQADGIFLLAQDTARNDLKVLMIPRDTMTEIGIIDENMRSVGTMVKQLTLAYANGDGRERSCENMKTAIENLLQGLQVNHYLAADMNMIAELNDAVGGVTVTIPTSGMEKADPKFVIGEKVILQGSQAERFVRYRDIETDYSALYRMSQHREYITGFFKTLQAKSRTDSQIVLRLFEQIQDHMITDMEKEVYLKIALNALEGDGLQESDFYTLPGSGVRTERYEEFYADEQGLIQLVLNLFYREMEKQ